VKRNIPVYKTYVQIYKNYLLFILYTEIAADHKKAEKNNKISPDVIKISLESLKLLLAVILL
jgi:hypothetical protein